MWYNSRKQFPKKVYSFFNSFSSFHCQLYSSTLSISHLTLSPSPTSSPNTKTTNSLIHYLDIPTIIYFLFLFFNFFLVSIFFNYWLNINIFISYLKNYRVSRFTFVLISEQIAVEMEIKSIFHKKYIIHRNKQFDRNINDKTTKLA